MRLLSGLLALSLVTPAIASAATHPVDVCLKLDDQRTDIGDGTEVGLANIPIRLEYMFLGFFLPAVGTVPTGDDGCAHLLLSGVDANTQIRALFDLQDTQFDIADGVLGYSFLLDHAVSVTSDGQRADLGTWHLDSSSTSDPVDFQAMTVWQSLHDLVDRYETFVGTWPGYFVGVDFPVSGDSSYATGTSVHIGENHWNNIGTLAHEYQHTVQFWDSGIPIIPAYCSDLTGVSPYPAAPPYEYYDPAAFPACVHSFNTFEGAIEANHEGQADFLDEFITGEGVCAGRWDIIDYMDGHSNESFPLNFDNEFRETNIAATWCDTVDTGAENTTYKHLWSADGAAVHSFDGPKFTTDAASGNTFALAAKGAELYELDLDGTSDVLLMNLSTSLGITFEPDRVALGLGFRFCASTPGLTGKLVCGKTNDSLSPIQVNKPAGTQSVLDVYMSATRLYVLTKPVMGTNLRVHTTDLSTITASPTWTQVTAALPADTLTITGGGAGNFLYASSDQAIRRCTLSAASVCTAAPTLWSGHDVEYGYRRGTRTNTRFASIVSTRLIGGDLYVHDAEGVAKIALSTGGTTFEQYIGPGEDKIFTNNMHRRSIAIDAEITDGYRDGQVFAKVGLLSTFHHHDGVWIDSSRDATLHTDVARFAFNDAIPQYEELFCGAEDVAINAEDAVRSYNAFGYYDSIDTLLTNAGLNLTQRSQVLGINWIDRNSNGCTFTSGDKVVTSSTAEADSGSTARTCGGANPGQYAQPTDNHALHVITGGPSGPAPAGTSPTPVGP